MVKYVCVLVFLMAFCTPAFAQDYAQFEIAMGYSNLGIKNFEPITGRHSGFGTYQSFNITSVFALENYVGYYGLGDQIGTKTQLITDTFGGRFNYRSAGPVLYGNAGIGGGFLRLPDIGAGSNNGFAFRVGGGVDIPWGDSLAIKVDVSRHSYRLPNFSTGNTEWRSGVHIMGGIVLKISQ
jgi:hypothetical protein